MAKLFMAVLMLGVALASTSSTGGADTVTPELFTVAGRDTSVTPGVVGDVIGKFTLDDTYRRGGPIGGAPDPMEMIAKQDTVFYQDFDGDGKYKASTLLGTVRPDDTFDVWVKGRFDEKSGKYTFLAEQVFSPPPPPYSGGGGGGNANPQPSLPGDMVNFRIFYVRGFIRDTAVRLIPQCCYSELYGFEVGQLEGTSSNHVARIAAAHGNGLRIYETPATTFWGSGKLIDRNRDRDRIVQRGNNVVVAGRYFWDGIDWRMLATSVTIVKDPGSVSGTGGTLQTTASLVRTSDGTFNETTQTFEGSTFEGRGLNFDGEGTGASMGLTLDWTWDAVYGNWDYAGTYWIQKDNATHRLEGQIAGTVASATHGAITGAMTVDQAYGPWNGWQGTGRILRGGATHAGPATATNPPVSIQADFWWHIVRP